MWVKTKKGELLNLNQVTRIEMKPGGSGSGRIEAYTIGKVGEQRGIELFLGSREACTEKMQKLTKKLKPFSME